MRDTLIHVGRRLAGVLVRRPGLAVGLWGEPGIGKTYGATQLQRETPCQWLSLHATVSLTQLLQALPRPKRLASWAEGVLDRALRGEHVEMPSLCDAIGAALAGLAPIIVYLEDLHEADAERQQFVLRLATAVLRLRGVGLLVTSRQRPAEPIEAVRLEPLGMNETRALLALEASVSLPNEAVEWIQARAAGNPLYTLEYFRFLARQGFLWNDGRRWRWRVPEHGMVPVTVEALIERLLGDAVQNDTLARVASARAVLPFEENRTVLAHVAGLELDELGRAMAELERRGVFLGEGFAHPLIRETALAGLDRVTRRDLARRALGALHDQPIVAANFVEDAELEPEARVQAYREAATCARNDGNPVLGARMLARAIPYLAEPERGGVALEAAEQLRHVDVPESARLAELAENSPIYRSQAVYLQAELLAIQGHIREAELALERLPERGTTAWYARLLQARGMANFGGGVLEILRDHPEVLENPDPHTVSRAARALAQAGALDQAETLIEKQLALDTGLESRVLLLKASSLVAYMRADFRRMEATEREILDLAGRLGNLRWVDAACFNLALALEALGRHRERMASLEAAMRTCIELGDVTALVIAQVSYASTLHAFGEYERAETMLLEARETLSRLDPSGYLVDCEAMLAHLYLDWQPPHGPLLALKHARVALAHALSIGDDRTRVEGHAVLAHAEAAVGDPGRALAQAEQALALARPLGMPVTLFEALNARGHALRANKRPDEAREAWLEAEATARGFGDQTAAQLVGLELDALAARVEEAQARLAWFEERGLHNGANLVRRRFGLLGRGEAVPATPQTRPALWLGVLGPMVLIRGDHVEPVRGRKRQELLALLLDARLAGRSEVSRLALLDALYPDADEVQANNALKEAIRAIRSSHGADVIRTTTAGYALGALRSDAEAFLEDRDLRRWRGPYLSGIELGQREDTVLESLHLNLREAIRRDLRRDPFEAVRSSKILLESEPYSLEHLELLLRAMQAAEQHKGIPRVYAQAQARFQEVGERLPERWEDFLEAARSLKPDPKLTGPAAD